MGLRDYFAQKRLQKIRQMKKEEPKEEHDFLNRVVIMSKEADMVDLRKHVFLVHAGKYQLKCYPGLLNEHLHEGRGYRLRLEMKPDEIKRVKSKETELALKMDGTDQAKYFVRGKIVTPPVRPKGKSYAVAVVDCGLMVHSRVGVTYRKGDWIEAEGTLHLTTDEMTKVGENTILVKEIDTGIRSDHGLHMLAVDSHKNIYLTSDIHGNNEYLMFKLSFKGEPSNEVDDDMKIPKGSYLANEDLRKAPRELLDAFGKFESFAFDEDHVFVCDGSSVIRVAKFNGNLDAIRTTNDLFFKDYIAEKFGVLKESVK